MAKFVVQDGEVHLWADLVVAVRDGKRVPGSRVIVTDRRVALLVPKPDLFARVLGRLFGRFARTLASAIEMTHQIARDEFEQVEQIEDAAGMLVFRSTGVGYAETRFEVFSMRTAAEWQERMRAWAAGDATP